MVLKRTYTLLINKDNSYRKDKSLLLPVSFKVGNRGTCTVHFMVNKMDKGYSIRWFNDFKDSCSYAVTDMEAIAVLMADQLWDRLGKMGKKLVIPVALGRT